MADAQRLAAEHAATESSGATEDAASAGRDCSADENDEDDAFDWRAELQQLQQQRKEQELQVGCASLST